MKKICVTGGIGSGKSVVCRICALRGVPVYDCDSRAKQLMTSDARLRTHLIKVAGDNVFTQDGKLNTQHLSTIIFTNAKVRKKVESEVHDAVHRDISLWLSKHESAAKTVIIETAIPRKSNIAGMVDSIWYVQAPDETRIARVQARSALSREHILKRMEAQTEEFASLDSDKTVIIDNSGEKPLLPVIDKLLDN